MKYTLSALIIAVSFLTACGGGGGGSGGGGAAVQSSQVPASSLAAGVSSVAVSSSEQAVSSDAVSSQVQGSSSSEAMGGNSSGISATASSMLASSSSVFVSSAESSSSGQSGSGQSSSDQFSSQASSSGSAADPFLGQFSGGAGHSWDVASNYYLKVIKAGSLTQYCEYRQLELTVSAAEGGYALSYQATDLLYASEECPAQLNGSFTVTLMADSTKSATTIYSNPVWPANFELLCQFSTNASLYYDHEFSPWVDCHEPTNSQPQLFLRAWPKSQSPASSSSSNSSSSQSESSSSLGESSSESSVASEASVSSAPIVVPSSSSASTVSSLAASSESSSASSGASQSSSDSSQTASFSSTAVSSSSLSAGSSSSAGSAASDSDADGVSDTEDNCPTTANPNQNDYNDNGIGDACDVAVLGEKVYRVAANIVDSSELPNADLTSTFDSQGTTHIAWHEDSDTGEVLYYASVTEDGVISKRAIPELVAELIKPTDIEVDSSGGVHIVAFAKRQKSGGTRSGNYAVYYAYGGAGGFSVSQVSANPTDPTLDTDSLYNASVNDRPQIMLNGNNATVAFYADANTLTSYDNWLILATNAGSSWSYQRAFNLDELGETFGATKTYATNGTGSVKLPQRQLSYNHIALMDISDYRPRFLSGSGANWTEAVMEGPSGYTDARHVQLTLSNSDQYHYAYIFDDDTSAQILYTTLEAGMAKTLNSVPLNYTTAGNYTPITVDLDHDGHLYSIYRRAFRSEEYLVNVDSNGDKGEVMFDVPGKVLGQQSLQVINGKLSYVTYGTDPDTGDGYVYVTHVTLRTWPAVE
ncbi:hypothetical protein [Cellvibrio sp. NN19]|uniref:hypothetical protein n=1 Tax=Cellvibrio chitinivorans TaxID=3102792 RepID=UPI002B40D068|nr:hypothetical protein [Cellvibrio sp. NN19]